MKANRFISWISIPLLVLMAFAMGLGAANASAQADSSVDPELVPGNPKCTDLGYAYGFKPQPEPPPSGVYTFPNTNRTVTIDSDGTYFDWVSTLGVDAVIVKGSNAANSYVYDPPAESFGDVGLHSPVNNSGSPAAISHIEFCYDLELEVSKTATTSYTRSYDWTIDKSVDDSSHVGFQGDSFTSNYTVVVNQTINESDFQVSGVITIVNPLLFPVPIAITDTINGQNVQLTCPSPLSVPPGGTYVCGYSLTLPAKTNGTNVVTVVSGDSRIVGGTASANFTFGDPTSVVGPATVTVTDSNVSDGLGTASDDKTFKYSKTFTCSEDEGTINNTATIVETGASDSASVTVACYELDVTKNAHTSLTRTWTWAIDKVGDQTNLILMPGQSFLVNYDVTVSATSVDSDRAVTGTITVKNSAPIDATLNSVADVISGGVTAVVDCDVTFPYTLKAGDSLVCTYAAPLDDGTDRVNTATATIQNTPSGTTSFTGSAPVSFTGADVTEVDECITVADDKAGALGTVCAGDALKTFSYSLWVGPYTEAQCGPQEYTNTASFHTNDLKLTGSDSWTVNVNVPCATGCTLTQGYWKTHSLRGPAPYDDAWLNIGDKDGDGVVEGADETFYKSGKTWYQVFWTSPAGNPYYNLAHQYMAAYLNKVNGASTTPDVEAALAWANTFFSSKTPSSSLSKADRNTVLSMASILDRYNNGVIGPGHCSE